MTTAVVERAFTVFFNKRNGDGRNDKRLAYLKGDSSASTNATVEHILALIKGKDLSLSLVHLCLSGKNQLFEQMSEVVLQDTIRVELNINCGFYNITLTSGPQNDIALHWVCEGGASVVKEFVFTLYDTLSGQTRFAQLSKSIEEQLQIRGWMGSQSAKLPSVDPIVDNDIKDSEPPPFVEQTFRKSKDHKIHSPSTNTNPFMPSGVWGADIPEEDWSLPATEQPSPNIHSPSSRGRSETPRSPPSSSRQSFYGDPDRQASKGKEPRSTTRPAQSASQSAKDLPPHNNTTSRPSQSDSPAGSSWRGRTATSRATPVPNQSQEPSDGASSQSGNSTPNRNQASDGTKWNTGRKSSTKPPDNSWRMNGSAKTNTWKNTSDSSIDDSAELLLLSEEFANNGSQRHELKTAPLVTRDANLTLNQSHSLEQYGVMGSIHAIRSKSSWNGPSDRRVYLNTNAPFSAIVCGVQGSGKSHTVSVMLENMLIPEYRPLGKLVKPLSGLVLHFGEGGPSAQACEAAWVGVPASPEIKTPPVTVFVAPSSINTMRRVYAKLGGNVRVEPLYFREDELDAEAILSMMAVGISSSAPLYVQIILSILRELGENYTWGSFQQKLEIKKKMFNEQQLVGLEQRLSLLQSFMSKSSSSSKQRATEPSNRFGIGRLTIIDLSDPFIDPASACGLFEIMTRIFRRTDIGTGKVLVVDEAHKYLSAQGGVSPLTNALLSMIRQMRHLALRIVISTQEPTVVPPVLLDLCSVAFLHRFSSPSWWDHLKHHISADCGEEGFDELVQLPTGQAIVFSPAALVTSLDNDGKTIAKQLGRSYAIIQTRQRVTKDGGASVLVVDEEDEYATF